MSQNVHATIPKGTVSGFERMAQEAIDVCLGMLKESNKSRFVNDI